MFKRTRGIFVMLLVATLILLAGCGGGANNAASNDEPAKEGSTTLRATCTTTPETLDPARGAGENDLYVYVNVYETLVVPSETDASPQPSLATDWTISEDGKKWTFTLHDDVKFSDGTPLTANDVKYSMDRMLTIGEGFTYIFKDVVESVNVVNNNTVEFALKKPFGPFLATLTCFRVLNSTLVQENTKSSGNYGDNGDYGTEYLLVNSAGSGPYVVEEFKVHESIKLKKNPNYWRQVPDEAPDTVLITELVEDSTTKMLVANGDLDLVHGRQQDVTLQALVQNPGFKYGDVPEFGLNYFMINVKKAPTDDAHIRRAISYAANIDEMRKIYGDPPKAYGPVPPTIWGASSDFGTFDYNIEKAKEEIALSKYANNLKAYPIQLSYIQGNGDTGKLAMLMANNLQAVGFEVKISEDPWVLFCNNAKDIKTSPNITNLFCTANYPEAGSILEFKYASWATGDWNQNEWLQDQKFDDMILDAYSTIDADARQQKYAEIQKYLVDEVVPSVYTFVSAIRPAWNSDAFTWRLSEEKPHAAYEYNFYFAEFVMK